MLKTTVSHIPTKFHLNIMEQKESELLCVRIFQQDVNILNWMNGLQYAEK